MSAARSVHVVSPMCNKTRLLLLKVSVMVARCCTLVQADFDSDCVWLSGAEEGLCAASSSSSSASSVPPLHLPEQQTLTHGGIPPPSSHDPSLYGGLLLLIFISVPEKKGLHERGMI